MRRTMVVITVGGPPGSGKTTVSKILAKRLDLLHVYTGDIFRKMAEEQGMSLRDFGEYALHHKEIDIELDRRQIELAENGNLILEGRLAGWMLYKNNIHAFKVWIDADLQVRAERVTKREGQSVEEAMQQTEERGEQERQRYLKIYAIDLSDISIYDCLIDSSNLTPDQVVDRIITALKMHA